MVSLYAKDTLDFKVRIAKQGLTNIELAKEIGITNTYLSAVVNGRNVGAATASKISSKLNCNIEDLFVVQSVDKSYTDDKKVNASE